MEYSFADLDNLELSVAIAHTTYGALARRFNINSSLVTDGAQ
jgi:hypothetical protein